MVAGAGSYFFVCKGLVDFVEEGFVEEGFFWGRCHWVFREVGYGW